MAVNIFTGSLSPWLTVLLPLLVLGIKLMPDKKKAPNIILLSISTLTILTIITYYPEVSSGMVIKSTVLKFTRFFSFYLKVDSAGFLFAIISSVLWLFTIIYSFGYMKDYENKTRYYVFLLLCLGITMGIAFSGNLLTYYTFYEMLTLATFPLVIHTQSKEAMKAGKKYLIYSLSGAALILMSIMFMSFLTNGGGLDFVPGGIIDGNTPISGKSLEIILFLFLAGFSVKSAVMPLHRWLPDAMVAPTPVSALFHAVAVVNSGVFGILRIVYYIMGKNVVFSTLVARIFLVLVLFTIIMASIIAFFQDNLKRRLAYSTISQLGYITLGILLLNPDGLRGGIYHIFNHALLKITLFFCAGIIYIVTHKKKISEMKGLGRKMPWTMGAFAIATLGMVGIPPSVGFNSKWFLLTGSLENGSIIIMGVLILSALLNAGYFFPIVIRAFISETSNQFITHKDKYEAPLTMLIPTIILSLLTIFIGIWYGLPDSIFDVIVSSIF